MTPEGQTATTTSWFVLGSNGLINSSQRPVCRSKLQPSDSHVHKSAEGHQGLKVQFTQTKVKKRLQVASGLLVSDERPHEWTHRRHRLIDPVVSGRPGLSLAEALRV